MEYPITLQEASLKDYPTVQNLGRFYAYDISRYCGRAYPNWEFPENGLYECLDFKKYFETSANHVFFIKIADEIAGFAIVDQLEKFPDRDWNMGQFFVVAKYQGCHVGQTAANLVFQKFPGKWSVGVIPENTEALGFWRKTINKFTGGKFEERRMSSEELKTKERPDPYPNIFFLFECKTLTRR